MATSDPQKTFWFIPSSHWEGAVFKTREEYLEIGLPHILTALRLLNDYPEYRFTLDQVCYVKPFLERYPEEADTFRRFIKEGRLQIAGAVISMFDANIPSGESIVRQMLYGKKFFREALGTDVTTGWALDTFGHCAQMPQIMKKCGYNSYWFMRGVPDNDVPSEWLWEGIDGTRIPAFYLPKGYGLLGLSPDDREKFEEFMEQRFESLTPWSYGSDRVGVASPDVVNPVESVPERVKEFNSQADKPFSIRLAVPAEYEKVIENRTDRKVIRCELNPIFQGGFSSRIGLKQKLRSVERVLTTAEKLGAIGSLLGKPFDEKKIEAAWEPTLFNQAHDLMAGVMMDHVQTDTLRGYYLSEHLGKELIGKELDFITSQADTNGEGVSLVVFNPLGWKRDDIVEEQVGFRATGILGVKIADPAGKIIPSEITQSKTYRDGSLKTARIIFLAKDMPAMGYSVFRAIPVREAGEATPQTTDGNHIENENYRLEFDMITGAMTSLKMKSSGWEVLEKEGNVVVRQFDGGDLWELYENLRSGSNIAMKRKQPIPRIETDQFSSEYRGEKGIIHRGPVYSEFTVAHNFGINNTFATELQGTFSTRVRIYSGMRRIDINTGLMNNDKYVRYQVIFPTTIKNGTTVHEIPFGAIDRPDAIEYPAQNWADLSDGRNGVALLNKGLPGNLSSGSNMMLSLMRSATLMSYGSHRFKKDIEPWMSSLDGLELGKEFEFEYSIVPHDGGWKDARVYRHGLEFNNPLLCRKAVSHTGRLPKSWGLFEISHPNVVLSAVKTGNNGAVILRIYEASGETVKSVRVTTNASINSAMDVNLIEDPAGKIIHTRDSVTFDLMPFEIKTIRMNLKISKLQG